MKPLNAQRSPDDLKLYYVSTKGRDDDCRLPLPGKPKGQMILVEYRGEDSQTYVKVFYAIGRWPVFPKQGTNKQLNEMKIQIGTERKIIIQ